MRRAICLALLIAVVAGCEEEPRYKDTPLSTWIRRSTDANRQTRMEAVAALRLIDTPRADEQLARLRAGDDLEVAVEACEDDSTSEGERVAILEKLLAEPSYSSRRRYVLAIAPRLSDDTFAKYAPRIIKEMPEYKSQIKEDAELRKK